MYLIKQFNAKYFLFVQADLIMLIPSSVDKEFEWS